MASQEISGTVTSTVVLDDPDGTYLTVDNGGVINAASGPGVVSAGTNPTNNALNNSGSITGGASSYGVDFSLGGSFNNFATITGGADAAGAIYGGNGNGNLYNSGSIFGGASAAGTGGTGLITSAYGQNAGLIQGGNGVTGGSGLSLSAYFSNNFSGKIQGGTGTNTGGTAVQLTSSAGSLGNSGSITGGQGTSTGGTGVIGFAGANLSNNSGTITGGIGGTSGGVGVILNGATLYNFASVAGGAGNSALADAISFGTGTGTLIEGYGYGATLTGDIGGFAIGDTVDLYNIPSTYDWTAHRSISGTTVTFTLPDNTTLTFDTPQDDNFQFAAYGAGGTQITLGAACYAAGTLIKTPAGDQPIQSLCVGDEVVTHSGAAGIVRWVGRRSLDCRRHPNPQDIWPICISAGALAENVPSKDLWVSPGHALLIGEHLVQASLLINGVTVRQIPRDHIEYWHVELDHHDVLLANDQPAESYLDTGNRTAFENGGAFMELHPDLKPKHWSETCFPLASEGPSLEQAKRQCLSRVADFGYRIVEDADVHLEVDGQRVEPVWLAPQRLAFLLPGNHQSIQLCSRTFIPAHVTADNGDCRSLGVCVGGVQLDGRAVDLAAPLTEGWHTLETRDEERWRWTSGRVPLPAATHLIVVDLLGPGGRYRVATAANQDLGVVTVPAATTVAA